MLIGAVVIGALVAGGSPAFASTSTQVPVESTGFFGGFTDTVAVSASDGWAVGGNGNGFVQRYNGTRWNLAPSPDLVDHGNANNSAVLSGVDATSATNAFAVGTSTVLNGAGDTAAAIRWNGSTWSRSTVTAPTGSISALKAVKAFSVSDAWAVGSTGRTTAGLTLAMHFNGTAWTQSPTPSPGTRDNILTSVAGSAPNDVWAVGYYRNLPYGNRIRLPLILHWNGTAWSQVSSPDSAAGQSTYLYDVAAISATDAWAVGYSTTGAAFVEHWNGTAWTATPAPPLTTLTGVTARSSSDVWAAGGTASGTPTLAHWTGTAWSLTTLTTTGGTGNPSLTAVTLAGPSTEWAVGLQWDSTTGQSSSIAFRVVG